MLRKKFFFSFSGEKLKSEWNVPENLLPCLQELPKSFDIICWQPQIFFISEAINLSKEYDQLKIHERNDWIEKKKREIKILQKENERYRELHDECRYDYVERAQRKFRTLYRIENKPMD